MKRLLFTREPPFLNSVRRVLVPLYFLFLLSLSDNIISAEVEGLYQGNVLVTSRDSDRERQSAFTDAFRQVLIKVTGNPDVLTQNVVRRALNNADNYVDTWSYRTVTEQAPAETTEDADSAKPMETVTRIEINVSFFQPEVLRLLDNANIPLWPGNRPFTLVWLIAQNELGERQLIGSSTENFSEIVNMLEMKANERALPLLLPILDFEDLRQVSTSAVWDMDVEKLLRASNRYQSESVLVIRLFRTLAGDVIGKSNYLFRGQVFELEVFESSLDAFISDSVALATKEISAYYAILLSGTDSNIDVNLTVEGISSAADYAALLDYVKKITDVNDYQITRVENQKIILRLSTGGQIRQLVETIALNRTLIPIGELLRNENQVFMTYQWNNQ